MYPLVPVSATHTHAHTHTRTKHVEAHDWVQIKTNKVTSGQVLPLHEFLLGGLFTGADLISEKRRVSGTILLACTHSFIMRCHIVYHSACVRHAAHTHTVTGTSW